MAGMMEGVSRIVGNVVETGEMIAFKHTIFALPFAVISLITAASPGWPSARTWLWVGVAMVSARTAAMAFNRLADHSIDSMNPRTAGRALPAGRLSRRFAWTVTAISAAVFIVAAANLNALCLALAPPTLAFLLGYSYTKRLTAASHLWLGLALGIAPIGAWIAVTADLAWPPVILAGAVSLWVAGSDIIYSLQDESADRAHALHSLPSRSHPRPNLPRSCIRWFSPLCRRGRRRMDTVLGRHRSRRHSRLAASSGDGGRPRCGGYRLLYRQRHACGVDEHPLRNRQADGGVIQPC